MTNQKQQSTPETNQTQKSGENVLSKIGSGVTWWVGSLMGKPQARPTKVVQETVQPAPDNQSKQVNNQSESKNVPPALKSQTKDDSIVQDVESLKKLVGKFSGGMVSKVTPVIKAGVGDTAKVASGITQKMGPNFIAKALRIFFIILLIIVLVFVGKNFIGSRNTPGENNPTPTASQANDFTPTPIGVYNPQQASVYANDPSILKLEEDINVITREVSSASLRESDLLPPTLDFNVSFSN